LAKDARLDGGYVVERVHEIAKRLPGAFEGAFASVGSEADTLRNRTMPRLKEHVAGVAGRATRPVSATASSSAGDSARGDKTWVPEHVRNGRRVAGHWRRNR
ncbi:MAG TPA: hypothetical protein VFC06_04365, partial [Demequina sp.]|nr:hypothetical protein [Demequina sp.]